MALRQTQTYPAEAASERPVCKNFGGFRNRRGIGQCHLPWYAATETGQRAGCQSSVNLAQFGPAYRIDAKVRRICGRWTYG